MNTTKYVDSLIEQWRASGAEKWRVAWSAALLCADWPYVFGAWGEECTPAARRRRARADHPTVVSKCRVLSGSSSSCSGCRWYPDGETVRCFDCRGFTAWCLKQAGITLKGEGATSQWNNNANWLRKGDIVTMPQNTLVCLFVRKGTKMEHTGFGLNNETCECSAGVQHFTQRNKKWTHWAIPRGLYGGDATVSKPTLRKGSRGDAVTEAQQALFARGYDLGPCGADGVFGAATEAAVKQFQRDAGLTADGIIGPLTHTALEQKNPAAVLYSVTVPHMTLYQAEALVKQYTGAWMTGEKEA